MNTIDSQAQINFRKNEGFSLVEVLLAIFVMILIGIAAVSLLSSRAVSLEDNTLTDEGETRTEEALSTLTAIAADLPLGGSFSRSAPTSETLTLAECTPQNCDYVLSPDPPAESRTSPAKGYPYGANLPERSQIIFLRRWRVDEIDAAYNLRKVTVAILKDEQSTAPLVLEEAIEPVNR